MTRPPAVDSMANTSVDLTKKRNEVGLTIARAQFKQALSQEKCNSPDDALPEVTPDSGLQFFTSIDALLKQHSAENLQKCKEWILSNISPSGPRTDALGEYLVRVSRLVPAFSDSAEKATRDRIKFLYLINDVLHAVKFHNRDEAQNEVFRVSIVPAVVKLIELAASCVCDKDSPHEKKLKALINYWIVSKLVTPADFRAFKHAATVNFAAAQGSRTHILPEYHGLRNLGWLNQPVSCILESLHRYPNQPITRDQVGRKKLEEGPVSQLILNLLENFHEKIDMKYLPNYDNPQGDTEKYEFWLDPLGQIVKRSRALDPDNKDGTDPDNKDGTDPKIVFNAWGWSPDTCQDMRDQGFPEKVLQERKSAQASMSRPSDKRTLASSGAENEQDPGRDHRPRSRHAYGSRDERSGTQRQFSDPRQLPPGGYESRGFDRRGSNRSNWDPPNTHQRGGYSSYNNANQRSSYDQGYSQGAQHPPQTSPYTSPSMAGQYGRQGLPQSQGGSAAMAMSSSFNEQYPAQSMNTGGFQNNTYSGNGNNHGNGHGNNNGQNQGPYRPRGGNGYGSNSEYGQNQGTYHGGGSSGGYGRAGYNNSRGSHGPRPYPGGRGRGPRN